MVEIVVCESISMREIEQEIANGNGDKPVKTKTYIFTDEAALQYANTHNDQMAAEIWRALERNKCRYNID
jgi:hypothetical protein